jgi:hypothetical protein
MNKYLTKASNCSNFYGNLVDSVLHKNKDSSRDIQRNTVHAQSISSKKRTFEQMKSAYAEPR